MNKAIYILLFVSLISVYACTDNPSKISVQNNLPKTKILNVVWGDVSISDQILPGETSSKIEIKNKDYHDITLPAKYPVKFYIYLNGDMVYLETKSTYLLGIEDEIIIELSDSTSITNSLLEE